MITPQDFIVLSLESQKAIAEQDEESGTVYLDGSFMGIFSWSRKADVFFLDMDIPISQMDGGRIFRMPQGLLFELPREIGLFVPISSDILGDTRFCVLLQNGEKITLPRRFHEIDSGNFRRVNLERPSFVALVG